MNCIARKNIYVNTLLTYTHFANKTNNDNVHHSVNIRENLIFLFFYIYHHYVTTRKSVIT